MGPGTLTPNHTRGSNRRLYGTNDAIARLYSSPGGTRRFPNSGNQSSSLTNGNSPYNRPPANTANQTQPYMSKQTHTPNPTATNNFHSGTGFNSYDKTEGQYLDVRSQGYNSARLDNRFNSLQSPKEQRQPGAWGSLPNGYTGGHVDNAGASKDSVQRPYHVSPRSGSQLPSNSSNHGNRQYSSRGYNTYTAGDCGRSMLQPAVPQSQAVPQIPAVSPRNAAVYNSSQYGHSAANTTRGGNSQTSWQYMENGRSRPNFPAQRSEVNGSSQQVNAKVFFKTHFYTKII